MKRLPTFNIRNSSLPKVNWNWLPSLLMAAIAMIGADVVAGILFGSFGLANLLTEDSVSANFVFYLASRLVGLSLIWWFIRRYSSGWSSLGLRRFKPLQAVGLVLLSGVVLIVATTIVFLAAEKLWPSFNVEQEQDVVFTEAQSGLEKALSFLALVVIAPISEEIVFRGLMLPAFAKRFGFIVGAIITAALFGLVHWQLNVAIVTLIMGLQLAWLYKKTGSLWPAILFHSSKNLVAFAILI